MSPVFGMNGVVSVAVRCPHGQSETIVVTEYIIRQAVDPQMVAEVSFGYVKDWCKSHQPTASWADPFSLKNPYWKGPSLPSNSITSYDSAMLFAELVKLVPALNESTATCPDYMSNTYMRPTGCSPNQVALYIVVIHLNDNHGWSREKVADWLETLPIDLTINTKGTHAVDRAS